MARHLLLNEIIFSKIAYPTLEIISDHQPMLCKQAGKTVFKVSVSLVTLKLTTSAIKVNVAFEENLYHTSHQSRLRSISRPSLFKR